MKNFNLKTWLSHLMIPVCFMLLSTSGISQGIDFKQSSWDKIMAMAKSQKKPVFLDAYASWCGPCKWMDKNVYGEGPVGDYYNSTFISVKIDMEKGEGPALAKKYGIRAYPTLLFISPDGSVEHKHCGSLELEEFIELGRIAVDPNRRLKEASLLFQNSKTLDPDNANAYFSLLEAGCSEMTADLNHYFGKLKTEEMLEEANWNMIKRYVKDVKSAAFAELMKHKPEFTERYGSEAVREKIHSVYSASLESAARMKDSTDFFALKKEIIQNIGDESEELLLHAEMTRSKKTGNWTAYATLANQYISNYAPKDWRKLNEVAWNFYENVNDKEHMRKAEEYVSLSVELNPGYGNMDTYAWVLFKNGKFEEAKEVASKAIMIGKEEGADTSDTEAIFMKLK